MAWHTRNTAVVVVAGCLCLPGGSGCGHRDAGAGGAAPAPRAAVPVRTVAIALQDAQDFNEFPGTVQSRVTVEVSARIAAHILQLPVRSGALVKTGDLLVTLDDRDVQARVRQVESALAAASAALTEAETDLKRYQELVQSGVASRQQLEQAQLKFDTTKAGVSQATEQLEEAKVNLGYTEIRSPIDGIVVEKHAESGDLASPGRSLLTLQKPTDLWLEAPVSEACARRIHIDDPVDVKIDTVEAVVRSHVTEIVPAVDPRSRSFLVRVTLPASLALQPGMFGRLRFRCESRRIIAVPVEAILRRGQLDVVYVVRDGRVHLRLIRRGRTFGTMVEVLAGVDPGDAVVLGPAADLADQDPVAAAPAAETAATPAQGGAP